MWRRIDGCRLFVALAGALGISASSLWVRGASLLKDGCIASTDFSGYDSPREAMDILIPSLASAMRSPVPDIAFVRSSDWGKVPQAVLSDISAKLSDHAHCVFGDIDEHLDDRARSFIAEIMPPKGAGRLAFAQANKQVLDFMLKNRSWVVKPSSTAPCLIHKRRCYVFPAFVYKLSAERGGVVDKGAALVQRYGWGKRLKTDLAAPRLPAPWWQAVLGGDIGLCGGREQLRPVGCGAVGSVLRAGTATFEDVDDMMRPEPIFINVSGLVCVDWTPVGRRDGVGGPNGPTG